MLACQTVEAPIMRRKMPIVNGSCILGDFKWLEVIYMIENRANDTVVSAGVFREVRISVNTVLLQAG